MGSDRTRYVYDGNDVIGEYNQNDALVCRYIMGRSIDEPLRMERVIGAETRTFYYQTNALGSIVALTEWDSGEETETVVERYTYDAYGRLLVHTPGADGEFGTSDDDYRPTSSVANPYGFTARALDTETGLMYYRARYYSTGQGRFVGRDPKGYVDGMNLYCYVKSNPFRYTDRFGLATNPIWPPLVGHETYGEYGGPGHGPDQYDEDTDTVRDRSTLVEPIDSLDRAFQAHDLCYEKAADKCTAKERNAARKKCDEILAAQCRRLAKIGMRHWGRKPGSRTRAKRWLGWAEFYFSNFPGAYGRE